jgi:hypothetical protein
VFPGFDGAQEIPGMRSDVAACFGSGIEVFRNLIKRTRIMINGSSGLWKVRAARF